MSFSIGQTVGPYKITAQLGQGGMATVYKAYHENLDRNVAIKVLHLGLREDETFLERFRREAQIVAKLEHPNIVPVYDFATFEEQPYLVMKFIEGRTLKQKMRLMAPDLEEVRRVISTVAEALDYAHRHDVLHRDVKPSNVVIETTGQLYLTDFGLARIASSGESTLSQDMMVGTPQYISPEQAQGAKDLDARTDVYSLGVVLYELVVGRVPFSGDTPYSIIHDHIYKPLPLPSEMNPAVPIEVEKVLVKALAKRREDRFASAGELADGFENAIEISQMKEISRQTLRPEAFAQPTEQEVSPPSQPVVVPSPPPQQSVTTTPTPAVIPTPFPPSGITPPPGAIYVGDSVGERSSHRQGGIWVCAGCLIFICTCLVSIGIVMNTLADPKLRDEVQASNEDPLSVSEELLQAARTGRLTPNEAEQYVEDYPDEPSAYFGLALTQLEADNAEAAYQTLEGVLIELSPSASLLGEWAAVMALRGYNEAAMAIYIVAVNFDSNDQAMRNAAGQYLYNQAISATLSEIAPFCALARRFQALPLANAMMGQALISASPRQPRNLCVALDEQTEALSVEQIIRSSIGQDDSFAEGYLILGNYYEAIEDREQAVENWTTALEIEDSPEWVKTRVSAKLE